MIASGSLRSVRTTTKCALHWLVPAAGIAALLVFLALTVSPVLNPPKWDEYIVVYDAHRVVMGQVPYRDFFNFIPPGIFFFLAAVFRLVGRSSIGIARWASVCTVLFGTALTWRALKYRGWGPWSRFLWALVFPVALYPWWPIASHHWLASVCFAAEIVLLAPDGAKSGLRLLLAGVVVGSCGLLVQTLGVVLGTMAATFLAAEEGKRLRRLLPWTAGILLVWLPFLIGMALLGAVPGFVKDCLVWPARSYSRGGNENAGPILQDMPWRMEDIWSRYQAHPGVTSWTLSMAGTVLYGSVLVLGGATVVLAAYHLVRALRRRSFGDPWIPAAIAAVALWTGLALKANVNWLHLLYFAAPTTVLWLFTLKGWATWPGAWRGASKAFLGVLLVSGVLYHSRGLWVHWPQPWELLDADRSVREQPVNRFLRSPGMLRPGDTVAAFPEGGEVYLYSAPAAIRFTYFKPLSQQYHTEEDHRIAAQDIRARKPRWIMFPPDLEAEYMDDRSAVAKILKADYDRAGTVGNAVLYRIREGREEKSFPGSGPTVP